MGFICVACHTPSPGGAAEHAGCPLAPLADHEPHGQDTWPVTGSTESRCCSPATPDTRGLMAQFCRTCADRQQRPLKLVYCEAVSAAYSYDVWRQQIILPPSLRPAVAKSMARSFTNRPWAAAKGTPTTCHKQACNLDGHTATAEARHEKVVDVTFRSHCSEACDGQTTAAPGTGMSFHRRRVQAPLHSTRC
jgi:hypothetical protein